MTVRPDGSKERLHGHTYNARVALDLVDISFEKFLDLGRVKRALDEICQELNERLLLPGKNPYFSVRKDADGELEFELCQKRYVVPREDAIILPLDNVIVETLAEWVAERLCVCMPNLADSARGVEVEITEVRGQGAVCYVPLAG